MRFYLDFSEQVVQLINNKYLVQGSNKCLSTKKKALLLLSDKKTILKKNLKNPNTFEQFLNSISSLISQTQEI